jgi:hypothetical protein
MVFEEFSGRLDTTTCLDEGIGTRFTPVSRLSDPPPQNNIVKGPQSVTYSLQTSQIQSLAVDAALVSALVAGIGTGILLELPANSLPPLERFLSPIAGAILADNPVNYRDHQTGIIGDEVFRAPEIKDTSEATRHLTPCSPLSKTSLSENASRLNKNWQRCLAPELRTPPQASPNRHHSSKIGLNKNTKLSNGKN